MRRSGPAVAVCLVGLSPAVVTEALYALAVRGRPRVVPGELHIVTTRPGLERVAGTLLGAAGALAQLRREYALPATAFACPPANVHLLTNGAGAALDDIVTTADSEAVGDQIARLVRDLAGRQPPVELHCTLAGGRKTMGALLATALQLHGRPGDRLYHVLVAPPFESAPEFFYPARRRRMIVAGGARVDARRAAVSLAEIPIVKLGPAAEEFGLTGHGVARLASEIEAEARGRLRLDPVVVDLAGRALRVGTEAIRLAPQQLALYATYARLRQACRGPACRAGGGCDRCHRSDDELHAGRDLLLSLYRDVGGDASRLEARWKDDSAEALGDFRQWIEQTRSRIDHALRGCLGAGPRGRQYRIQPLGGADGPRRRGLGIAPRLVRLVGRQA